MIVFGAIAIRSFSKEVTGTESNHKAVHKVIVNFTTHKDNAHSFCRDCVVGGSLTARLYEPTCINSMIDYINKYGLDKCGWGTDHEIRAFVY